jgi:hypothetical protein
MQKIEAKMQNSRMNRESNLLKQKMYVALQTLVNLLVSGFPADTSAESRSLDFFFDWEVFCKKAKSLIEPYMSETRFPP